jgi:hypothetical protein
VKSTPVRGQLSVFLVLTVLGVLSLGGAAWSAFTGPRVADVQLQTAAANTVAATSLIARLQATITASVSAPSQSGAPTATTENEVEKVSETVDYQAPDRVHATTTDTDSGTEGSAAPVTSSETQIGDACWTNSPAGTDVKCTAGAVSSFLDVVSGLKNATGITERSGTYYLSPKATQILVNALDGGQANALGGSARDDSAEVRIDGDTVSWEKLTVNSTSDTAGESVKTALDILVTFSDIGSAPPVEMPSGPPTATG